MRNVLVYLNHWKKSVDKRKGPFSIADKKQMTLSEITQNGMKITSKFIVSMVQGCLLTFIQLIRFWN